MTEAIYWATLNDLTPIIKKFPVPDEAFMMLEKLPLGWLDINRWEDWMQFTRFQPTIAFNGWGRGRIFNTLAELRWEQMGDTFQIVYVGTKIDLPAGFTRDDCLDQTDVDDTKSYYLWGERIQEDLLTDLGQPENEILFLELQIPRLLRYPVSDQFTGRVKLKVVEYYDSTSGQLVYYRFKGVEPA